MRAYVPLILLIIGLALFLFRFPPSATRLNELGRICIWIGLSALMAQSLFLHDVVQLPRA